LKGDGIFTDDNPDAPERVDLLITSTREETGNLHPPVSPFFEKEILLIADGDREAGREFGSRIGRDDSFTAGRREIVRVSDLLWDGGDIQGGDGTAVFGGVLGWRHDPAGVARSAS